MSELAPAARDAVSKPRGAQKMATKAADAKAHAELLDRLSPADQRVLRGFGGPQATRCLTDPAVRMSIPTARTALRLRLMLAVLPPGSYCICGELATNHHVFTCPAIPGGAAIRRHNAILTAMMDALDGAGVHFQHEPRSAAPGQRTRLDLEFMTAAGGTMGIDVSVAYPATDKAAIHASNPDAAADARAREKTAKYQTTAQNRGIAFSPAVWETSGAMHASAVHVLATIRATLLHGVGGDTVEAERLLHAMLADIQAAIADGNSALFTNVLLAAAQGLSARQGGAAFASPRRAGTGAHRHRIDMTNSIRRDDTPATVEAQRQLFAHAPHCREGAALVISIDSARGQMTRRVAKTPAPPDVGRRAAEEEQEEEAIAQNNEEPIVFSTPPSIHHSSPPMFTPFSPTDPFLATSPPSPVSAPLHPEEGTATNKKKHQKQKNTVGENGSGGGGVPAQEGTKNRRADEGPERAGLDGDRTLPIEKTTTHQGDCAGRSPTPGRGRMAQVSARDWTPDVQATAGAAPTARARHSVAPTTNTGSRPDAEATAWQRRGGHNEEDAAATATTLPQASADRHATRAQARLPAGPPPGHGTGATAARTTQEAARRAHHEPPAPPPHGTGPHPKSGNGHAERDLPAATRRRLHGRGASTADGSNMCGTPSTGRHSPRE